ncbi:MAG: SAM-dependent methyltransferase [Actinoallomurus sp.]
MSRPDRAESPGSTAVDRQAADNVIAALPDMPMMVQENRRFLHRAIRFLAGDAGMRQFLDIGAGLPTQGNVHSVAQTVAPDARVVYVDNDPMVVTHRRGHARFAWFVGNPRTTLALPWGFWPWNGALRR